MALIAEAAELVEHFQWVDGGLSHLLEDKTRQSVEEELADILSSIWRITLCSVKPANSPAEEIVFLE
jgi:NTP pyrophosphatase (non-canonical NTP hydrolase)